MEQLARKRKAMLQKNLDQDLVAKFHDTRRRDVEEFHRPRAHFNRWMPHQRYECGHNRCCNSLDRVRGCLFRCGIKHIVRCKQWLERRGPSAG